MKLRRPEPVRVGRPHRSLSSCPVEPDGTVLHSEGEVDRRGGVRTMSGKGTVARTQSVFCCHGPAGEERYQSGRRSLLRYVTTREAGCHTRIYIDHTWVEGKFKCNRVRSCLCICIKFFFFLMLQQ